MINRLKGGIFLYITFFLYFYFIKKVIYTVITNGYDELLQAPNFTGWDKIVFTDSINYDRGWEVRRLPKGNSLIQSRDIKIRSHIHLKDYDVVCYIDGNQKFVKEPCLCPIRFSHPRRKDIWQEAKQIIKLNKAPEIKINQQIRFYENTGYKCQGLLLNGFFVREHSEKSNKLHDVWFEEFVRFPYRDQLSLPYAIWKTGIRPPQIKGSDVKEQFAHITKIHA